MRVSMRVCMYVCNCMYVCTFVIVCLHVACLLNSCMVTTHSEKSAHAEEYPLPRLSSHSRNLLVPVSRVGHSRPQLACLSISVHTELRKESDSYIVSSMCGVARAKLKKLFLTLGGYMRVA